MWTFFIIAARNLAQHRRRTLLLGGAVAGVTTMLVLLLALSEGIQTSMLESATTLITGHVNVGGFFKPSAGQSAPVVLHASKVREIVKKAVPEMDYMVERGRGFAKIVSESGSAQTGLSGIDIDSERGLRRNLKLISGSLDGLREPNTVLIFKGHADKLSVKVGDVVTISGQTGRGITNTIDVRVVAIAKDVGLLSAFSTFMPAAALRSFYQLADDSTGAFQIYLQDMKDIPAVEERLRLVMAKAGYKVMDKDPQVFWQKFQSVNREGWTGQKIDITDWKDESSFLNWALTIVQALSVALILVLLVIIGIGIMNTLWIAIRERTREIGTLRAIGMQRWRVMGMFLIEAFTLALSSTFIGAVVGVLICAGINLAELNVPSAVQLFLMATVLRLVISPLWLFVSILFITGCAMVVSLVPSYLAARLKPITAMHHIG